jgi:hypothetical protein
VVQVDTTTTRVSSPPPGWYADPDDATQLRYWNGTAWTESRSPAAQEPPADASTPPEATTGVPRSPSRAEARVAPGLNVYDSAVDLDQALTPEERAAFSQHTLSRFPVWLVVVLHFLTLGIFTFIYQGLKLSKLPLLRENDFGAGKGIGYCFIPFYDWYWMFRFVNAINDRLNFQLRLRGDRPRSPRGLGIASCILLVIATVGLGVYSSASASIWLVYTFYISWLILMPIMSAYMQAATNRLVDMREREIEAGATP